jgi:hypothetical protein
MIDVPFEIIVKLNCILQAINFSRCSEAGLRLDKCYPIPNPAA